MRFKSDGLADANHTMCGCFAGTDCKVGLQAPNWDVSNPIAPLKTKKCSLKIVVGDYFPFENCPFLGHILVFRGLHRGIVTNPLHYGPLLSSLVDLVV